jgi:hypothetical protein
MEPHEEFIELCALSATGELSAEEQERLERHLTGCRECSNALREFATVVDVGVPSLIPQLSDAPSQRTRLIPNETATPDLWCPENGNRANGFGFERRNGHQHAQPNWKLGWLSLAAMVLLAVALGIYAYRSGKGRGLETASVAAISADAKAKALELRRSDAAHEREVLDVQLAERDRAISSLRHEVARQSATLNQMKMVQANLEQSIMADEAVKQQWAETNASLGQELKTAEAALEKTQTDLNATRQHRAENEARVADLNAQIDALSAQVREKTHTIEKQEELLAHDRDIRELMGARDLYIAEIYDVARDGETQKPFGRIFYTKERSLVFYAYDLDKQPRVKDANTFQAWGRRGQGEAGGPLNLGVFYQDNAANKRWVLKFDNPKELSEIDAVFVTVEPRGGSYKPTGKPLLFAYLKMNPNHP